jgi:hypothetical protein
MILDEDTENGYAVSYELRAVGYELRAFLARGSQLIAHRLDFRLFNGPDERCIAIRSHS